MSLYRVGGGLQTELIVCVVLFPVFKISLALAMRANIHLAFLSKLAFGVVLVEPMPIAKTSTSCSPDDPQLLLPKPQFLRKFPSNIAPLGPLGLHLDRERVQAITSRKRLFVEVEVIVVAPVRFTFDRPMLEPLLADALMMQPDGKLPLVPAVPGSSPPDCGSLLH